MLLTGGSVAALNEDGKIALASVTMFAVTAVLFFIVGFASGYSCKKQKNSATETASPVGIQKVIPLYEDIGQPKNDEQQLELNENSAYGGNLEKQLELKTNESYGQVEKQLDLKANEAYGHTKEQLKL